MKTLRTVSILLLCSILTLSAQVFDVRDSGNRPLWSSAQRSQQPALSRIANLMAAGGNPNIMIFGDSVMGGDELSDELVELYSQMYGFSGGMGGIGATEFDGARFSRRFGSDVFSGATAVHDLKFSFVDFALLPAAGFTQFGAASGLIGMTGTVFEVWYMVSNTFGGFDIRTNDYNGGGAMNVAAIIVANDTTLAPGVTSNKVFRLTNSAPFCSVLRCTGLSNSCVIKSMGIFDYSHPGIIWNVQSRGGETLANWATVPTNQYQLMWQQWAPDIIMLKTVNGGAVSISNTLAAVSAVIDYSTPGSAVIPHGMHPSSVNDPDVVAENVALLKWSQGHRPPYDYFDTHALLWDSYPYAYMMDMLYPNPNVHLNQRGANHVAWAFYNWLNLLGDRGLYRSPGLLRVPQPVNTFSGFNHYGGLPNGSSNAFQTWQNGFISGWTDPNGVSWMVPTNGVPRPSGYVIFEMNGDGSVTNITTSTNSVWGTGAMGSPTLDAGMLSFHTNRDFHVWIRGNYFTGTTPVATRLIVMLNSSSATNTLDSKLFTPTASKAGDSWYIDLDLTPRTSGASGTIAMTGTMITLSAGAPTYQNFTNSLTTVDLLTKSLKLEVAFTNGATTTSWQAKNGGIFLR